MLAARFQPAEDAAGWCLNKPCLITLSRNSRPDKPFKSHPRGERDLVLSCSNATPSPQNWLVLFFFFYRALTAGVPARSGLCGERWGSPPPVPHHTFPMGRDPPRSSDTCPTGGHLATSHLASQKTLVPSAGVSPA